MPDDNAITTYDPQFDIKIDISVSKAVPSTQEIEEALEAMWQTRFDTLLYRGYLIARRWSPPRIPQQSLAERIATLLLFEQDQARKERANSASAKL